MDRKSKMKFISDTVTYYFEGGNYRAIFDSLCGEYTGPEESARAVKELMKDQNCNFETIFLDYLRTIKSDKLYWLEGLHSSLLNLCFFCEETRSYIKSYKWENLFLEKPFSNVSGFTRSHWQNSIEKIMSNLVDQIKIIESGSSCYL